MEDTLPVHAGYYPSCRVSIRKSFYSIGYTLQ